MCASVTAVVAVAFVLGAAAFVLILRGSLEDGVRESAEREAGAIAARLDQGETVDLGQLDDDALYQVIVDGEVRQRSANAPSTPLARDDDGPGAVRIDDERFLLGSEDAGGGALVVVGHSAEDAQETLRAVAALLLVAVPVVVLAVAASSWVAVGRALRPVDRMRREVDAVSSANLGLRLADPGSGDEIGALAATMNRMLDRLDKSQRAQRRFVSDASHELRTPLASLRQLAEVAQGHPDRVDAQELAGAVIDEGARLERLVQGLLLLARADEQALAVARRPVDVDDLVLAEASRLRASGRLSVDATDVGPARVLGDEALLGHVVRNLAANAARHARSRIALVLREGPAGVVLAVEDDGDGIPPADRERVLERFVRLDDARARDDGGSGLGLSIVREVVVGHGGSVSVGTSRWGGARIEVRLPGSTAGG